MKNYRFDNKNVILLSFDEISEWKSQYPYLEKIKSCMSPVRYCKVEVLGDCMQGTIKVPRIGASWNEAQVFGFYMGQKELLLVEDGVPIRMLLERISKGTSGEFSYDKLLLQLFENLIENDIIDLQQEEEKLAHMEERILRKIPNDFYETVVHVRKQLSAYHSYYEQMEDIGEQMVALYPEQTAWISYTKRVERLHHYVELLKEYLVQIRELYQSLIAVQQNRIIGLLTVVTTLFLPLSLIAGWYGMNFPNMPEFQNPHAYPIVVLVSITIIILEIIFFRRKKIL